jgi:hypothetical protein
VAVQYAGFTPAPSAQVLTFGNGDTSISTSTGSATSRTLPPYSLTTLILRPASSLAGPAAPGQPTASAITARDATITWPAATGGVKYELYRQNGTTSEQWGETTGTSFTVHNLTPGTQYTANVITRDGAGRVALSYRTDRGTRSLGMTSAGCRARRCRPLRTRMRMGRRTPPGRRVRAGGLCAVVAAVSTAETEPVAACRCGRAGAWAAAHTQAAESAQADFVTL